MPSQFRAISAQFLLPLAAVAFMEGCGESVQSPPVAQEAVKLSPEQEHAALVKKAESGDIDAQSNLGRAYANGEGVPEDKTKAAEWFQKAAEQGHPIAQLSLGEKYSSGEGVPKDATKAAEWFQKAAAQGNAEANFRLGGFYHRGEVVSQDHAKAAELYEKAAEKGNSSAQRELFLLYEFGIGVPKNTQKAFEWAHKAAIQGEGAAMVKVAWSYWHGNGVARDNVLAYAWANIVAVSSPTLTKLRNEYELSLSSAEKDEAQRLSTNWKKGQPLAREGSPTNTSNTSPSGALSKQNTGTAFFVSNSGQAITNNHVIDGCKEIRAEGREGVVKVTTADTVNDLALVQIGGTIGATAAIHPDPAKLRQGDEIVVFGFPLNAVLSSGGNLTPGVVSALTGLGNNTNQIQITAPIQPGSSGSPVLNRTGEVIGVVSMKLSDLKMAKATGSVGQNVNFAVSGQTLKSFLDTHKVDYRKKNLLSFEKSTADLADEARTWTLVLECWK